MTTSADLGIPFIDAGQGQPEVTHNEALLLLQAISKGVVDRGVNTPAVGPTIGDSYIIGAAPTGAWAGRANCVTIWSGTAWDFIPGETSAGTPITMGARQEGLRVWVNDDDAGYVWTGSAWEETGGGSSQLGIASSLASGDHYLSKSIVGGWSTTSAASNNTNVLLQPIIVDSPAEFSGIALNITTPSNGVTLTCNIHECLGAGKPGVSLGQAVITSTSSAGIHSANFASPISLPAGAYFLLVLASTTGISCAAVLNNAEVDASLINVLVEDWLLNGLTGTTERGVAIVDVSDFPGGSYTPGDDLTSHVFLSSNVTFQNACRVYALVVN